MWWVVGYLWWFGILSSSGFCCGCGFFFVGFLVFFFFGMILMGWFLWVDFGVYGLILVVLATVASDGLLF